MKKINLLFFLLYAISITGTAQDISFETHTIDNNFTGPAGIYVSDISNDNRHYIISAGTDINTIAWWRNDLFKNEVVVDYDGNSYNTVSIGNQIWLKENLESLHYADGTEITEVWAYDDDEANVETYGRLYTWEAAMNYSTIQGVQGVCPDNWHVPTDAEWTELGTFLGGDNVAGGKLKSTGTELWQTPNAGATNESGFTALPAGEYDDTHYQLLNQYAVMWSSTETSGTWCKYRYLSYEDAGLHTYNYYKDFRYSVRCIKDALTGIDEQGHIEKKFKISPNPANETISIRLSKQTSFPIEIDIYDVSGRHLKTTRVNSNEDEIDISDFPKDMYFVTITIFGDIITEKFIKK